MGVWTGAEAIYMPRYRARAFQIGCPFWVSVKPGLWTLDWTMD